MTHEQLLRFTESQAGDLMRYKKSLTASVKACKKLMKENETLQMDVESAKSREKLVKTTDKDLGALEEVSYFLRLSSFGPHPQTLTWTFDVFVQIRRKNDGAEGIRAQVMRLEERVRDLDGRLAVMKAKEEAVMTLLREAVAGDEEKVREFAQRAQTLMQLEVQSSGASKESGEVGTSHALASADQKVALSLHHSP